MRKQLLAGVAFTAAALMGTAAFAADPIFEPAPVAPPPAPIAPAPIFYDWTGFYVGGHVGLNWERKRLRHPGFDILWEDTFETDIFLVNDPLRLTMRADGFHGGLQIGGNWQFNQFVFGLEGDFSWTNADDSKTVPFHFAAFFDGDASPFTEQDHAFTYTQKIKWFGTARARLGYAFENILIYGTGGFAWKRSELTLSGFIDPDGFPDWAVATHAKDSNTHTGWAIGAGAEIGITENVSIKGEWLYMDLGSKTYNLHVTVPDFLDGADEAFNVHTPTRVKLTEHVVRVGLNWRFVTAPAAAPMAPAPAPVKW